MGAKTFGREFEFNKHACSFKDLLRNGQITPNLPPPLGELIKLDRLFEIENSSFACKLRHVIVKTFGHNFEFSKLACLFKDLCINEKTTEN